MMTCYVDSCRAQAPNEAAFAETIMAAVARAFMAPVRAWRRHVTIQHMQELDEHLLRDIGLARDDIRNAVYGKSRARREIEFPSGMVSATHAAVEDWARQAASANGFADAGRS